VLIHLVNHPHAKEDGNQNNLLQAEKQVKVNLAKLEALKPRINKRYERYQQLMRERESRKPTTYQRDDLRPSRLPSDPALAGVPEPLEAAENRELAVRLAHKEISRRATARRGTRQAGIPQEEERRRRMAGVSAWGDWEDALGRDVTTAGDDLSARIREVRLNIDQPSVQPREHRRDRQSVDLDPTESAISAYKYPSVPRQRPLDASSPGLPRPRPAVGELSKPPELPPKEQPAAGRPAVPPPVPSKVLPAAPPIPNKEKPLIQAAETPSDLNPSTFTFKPSAYLENGTPLRTVFLPPDLRTRFLAIAAPNTRRNLETCGILCGTLISNALFISKLLIPEQESTSDTCETVNESAIFDYCDSEDLMVLGWIHTHPTQTCFMSSRDLHTHCGYQVMLPESIAIVCAPSKSPDWGVFRLTDPPGLKSVLNCTQTGLFHPHAETNLYIDALRPGHVFEAQGLEFETADLRPEI
jgi:STAM-binding protein